ncbi:hypothetical protein V8E53_011017, partial [Lactarius tabidus]
MPQIANDPTQAVCPSFEDPEWEFLRQSTSTSEAVHDNSGQSSPANEGHMGSENLHKVDAWNTQLQQDLVEQEEQIRITCEAEEAQRAQQEAEDKRIHREAKNKKLKLNLFDPKQHVKKWIEHRPATFALNKLNNLEYIELDYFTMRGCKEAMANTNKSVSHDTLTFMQQGDTFVIPPLAAIRPSKHIRNNEELSWEEMMDAKNMMLHFMVKSGLWQNKHTLSIVSFYVNLNCHP